MLNIKVSFAVPLDGYYGLNGQADVNQPNVLCP